jgi:GT2 family glycosyltransferase
MRGQSRTPGPTPVARLRVDGKFFARGAVRMHARGVTYGPFAAGDDGEPFPAPGQITADFQAMRAAGINAIRTYHLPPARVLEAAGEAGLGVFADVPWPKHLCFLDSGKAQRQARRLVRSAAELGRRQSCVLAYSIGNEIPPDVVRWHGRRRVARFLAELKDTAKQADPAGLVTYSNFPSTEYLDLSFLDFATFNVYLHDRKAFRRYLMRLQNIVGDKPLVLGELGMCSRHNGMADQAAFLTGHLREAVLSGLAGAFVFSWTDDWHTGGHAIQDWAFGLTAADRTPKPALDAVRSVFTASPAELLTATPRVSVVVCTYNGGRTLDQCLQSLMALDYPDYEIIIVDDGSTDDTPNVLDRYPTARAIRQPNLGLSEARNVGLRAANGEIIAYTDSDCFVDPYWLSQLVRPLLRSSAAAVGGPNLPPDDGPLAASVAAAPGQPMHVLESDQVAEHIPGCNMAFRRDALLAIRGFDPAYRKAGDDVDVCWRLQQAGRWITFAPGAFVWHHRRQTPWAYLRQQAGYGEAEALLRFIHPDKFNNRGDGKWRGVAYGPSLHGLSLSGAFVYHGTFGTGLFQCLYQPGPAHWAMLPGTLEWHVGAAALAAVAIVEPWAWAGVGLMMLMSLFVAAIQAAQARIAPPHDSRWARLMVMLLCYAQPLVRSWARYKTRLFEYRAPRTPPGGPWPARDSALPFGGKRTTTYWSEDGAGRLRLVECAIQDFTQNRWGRTIDSGWADWDVELYCHPWTVVQIGTAEEDHGSGRRLVRVRYRLRASGYLRALGVAASVAGLLGVGLWSWVGGAVCAVLAAAGVALWWRGTRRAALAGAVVDRWAAELGMARIKDVC